MRTGLAVFAMLATLTVGMAGEARAASGQYKIFFDWDKAEIGDAAGQILARAASEIAPRSRVVITGHVDASETASRGADRAAAIRDKLVSLGAPASARFTVVNKGAARPLVKTPPNVREPQNRFVELVIR